MDVRQRGAVRAVQRVEWICSVGDIGGKAQTKSISRGMR